MTETKVALVTSYWPDGTARAYDIYESRKNGWKRNGGGFCESADSYAALCANTGAPMQPEEVEAFRQKRQAETTAMGGCRFVNELPHEADNADA